MILIQSQKKGFKPFLQAHRRLIKDGVLQTTDNKGHKEKLHFYLFNDLMVFANKSDVKKQKNIAKLSSQWPIGLVWVSHASLQGVSLSSGSGATSFLLTSAICSVSTSQLSSGSSSAASVSSSPLEIIGPNRSFIVVGNDVDEWVAEFRTLLSQFGML